MEKAEAEGVHKYGGCRKVFCNVMRCGHPHWQTRVDGDSIQCMVEYYGCMFLGQCNEQI